MAVSLSDGRTAAWLAGNDVSGDEWWNDGERCGVGPEGADDSTEAYWYRLRDGFVDASEYEDDDHANDVERIEYDGWVA